MCHLFAQANEHYDLLGMDVPPGEKEECTPLLLWQVLDKSGPRQVYFGINSEGGGGGGGEWSLPVNVEELFSAGGGMDGGGGGGGRRWEVAVPIGGDGSEGDFQTWPLLVTVHPRAGQVFLVAGRNERPSVVIRNGLGAPVRYAQFTRDEGVFGGAGGQRLVLQSGKRAHYSHPRWDERFPEDGGGEEEPKLVFSLAPGKKQSSTEEEIGWSVVGGDPGGAWSSPVETTEEREEFLQLPLPEENGSSSDVLVRVGREGDTVLVELSPASAAAAEISAMDIRSRIPSAEGQEDKREEARLPMRPHVSERQAVAAEAATSSATSPVSDGASESGSSFVAVPAPAIEVLEEDGGGDGEGGQDGAALQQEEKGVCGGGGGDLELTAGLTAECLSLVLSDDCLERENQVDEYLRLTLDGVCASARPVFKAAQGGGGRGKAVDLSLTVRDAQLDNQVRYILG